MAEVIADLVYETSSTSGTGALSLEGAVSGFRSFVEGIGDGNQCRYYVTDGVDYEVGIGTVTAGTPATLSRDIVETSSNGGNLVDFGTAQKDVYHIVTTQKIHSLCPRVNTIFIDAGAMMPAPLDGASPGIAEYQTNDIGMDYFLFASDVVQGAEFKLVMPEDWDGNGIKAKFLWSSDAGSSVGETVEWGMKAVALQDGDTIDASMGSPVLISDAIISADGASFQITAATSGMIPAGTPGGGVLIAFKVFRNVSGADDMAVNARLFGVFVQYVKSVGNVIEQW